MRQLFHSRNVGFELFDVDILSATEEELEKISDDMGLALNLDEMKYVMGRKLDFDAKNERFAANCSEANKLLTRAYREPFVVPEKV